VSAQTGIVIRPCVGETVCGDAQVVIDDGDMLLVAVVDGLGHGPGAAEASEAFVEFVRGNPRKPLENLMAEGSSHISSTRGAAAAIVRLDFAHNSLGFCGVGNVHFHSLSSASIHPVCVPGIVGHRVRKIIPYEFELPEQGTFVLCSDGISSRIHLEEFPEHAPQALADAILAQHGKSHDDATCVAVAYSAA